MRFNHIRFDYYIILSIHRNVYYTFYTQLSYQTSFLHPSPTSRCLKQNHFLSEKELIKVTLRRKYDSERTKRKKTLKKRREKPKEWRGMSTIELARPRFRPSAAPYPRSLVFIRFAIQSVESRGIFPVPFNASRSSSTTSSPFPRARQRRSVVCRDRDTVRVILAPRGDELMIPGLPQSSGVC